MFADILQRKIPQIKIIEKQTRHETLSIEAGYLKDTPTIIGIVFVQQVQLGLIRLDHALSSTASFMKQIVILQITVTFVRGVYGKYG